MNDVWGAIMLVAGGLFAGGAAAFAWSRVPIWRRMPQPEFVRDFDQTIRWTDKVQPGLAIVAGISGIGFAVTAEGAARIFAALGAAGFMVVVLASVAVLVPLQRRIIAAAEAEEAELEAMRTRWFGGNLGRSILSVAAFVLLAVAAVA